MTDIWVEEQSKSTRIKTKVKHEMKEGMIIVCYLALFFFAFYTYRMLLLHTFRSALFVYGAALVRAMVLTKVIMIGQALQIGKRWEDKPVLHSSVFKAALFAVLVGIFQVLEDVVRSLFHGESLAGAFREMGPRGALEVVVLGVVGFCVFIPGFALLEIRRVMGEEPFFHLFLRRKAIAG